MFIMLCIIVVDLKYYIEHFFHIRRALFRVSNFLTMQAINIFAQPQRLARGVKTKFL